MILSSWFYFWIYSVRRFVYKMLPAGFGKGTLKLSDKYKLITRQLLYVSSWSQFRWMKSNSLRLFYSSFILLFIQSLIPFTVHFALLMDLFLQNLRLHKNSKTWLIDHVKFDISHSKKLLPRIYLFNIIFRFFIIKSCGLNSWSQTRG